MFKSLKNQLVFFSIGVVLVTSAIFMLISQSQQATTQQLEYSEQARFQANLFHHIGENSIIRLRENIFQATRNPSLLEAINAQNIAEIKRHAVTFENRIVASQIATDIRITDQNGKILYSKVEAEIGQTIASAISQLAAKEVLIHSGYEVFANELRNHYSFPLTQRGKTMAVIHFTLSPKLVFADFSKLASVSHWIVVDPQGNQLAASKDIDQGVAIEQLTLTQPTATIYQDEQATYRQIGSLIQDYNGQPIATLTTFTDNTAAYAQLNQVQYMTIAIIIAWLLIAALFTWFFIARKLKPLAQMRAVAANIAKTGDLTAKIKITSDDEIGQSAQAINGVLNLMNRMIGDANSALEQVNQGNFNTQTLSGYAQHYQGDLAAFMVNLKTSVDALHFTMNELQRVAKALHQGDFQVEMSSQVQGEIRHTINNLAHNLSDIFADINQVMAGVTLSDFSRKVSIQAKGEFATLIQSINHSIENLNNGFNDVVSAAQRMANNDFSTPIQTEYQFAMGEAQTAMNHSMQDISQTLAKIRLIAHQVNQETHTVTDVTESLKMHIHEQADSLNTTSNTIQTTASQVAANLKSTQEAADIADGQKGLLDNANSSMQHTQDAMLGIKEASEQISNITSIINGIAFQTNLLALNAAVEAARAGEHGRGFAVVAGEVRALAGKSGDAAKEISTLVEKTAQAVEHGVSRVDEVNAYLQQITEQTDKMLDVVTDISHSSNEQTASIHNVTQAIAHIDSISQQNAAQIEASHEMTEQMQSAADDLTQSVSAFKLIGTSS